jgi:Fe-S cluster biogenesis protein NfuA
MFIQTEATPNPATLKFLPGRAVLKGAPLDFPDRDQAARSPLATRLFGIEGVTGVFLGGDFVSVSKHEGAQWYQLKPAVLAEIMDHFTAGEPVLLTEDTEDAAEAGDLDGIAGQIRELLDTRVRPAVAMDGGDITFEGFEDGVVYLHLKGACAGCPSSTATLKSGIENMLRHYIPEVLEVRAV